MKLRVALSAAALSMAVAIAGGPAASFGQSAPNVMGITVWAGPYGKYINGPFASVKVCRAGTAVCQRVGGLLVDTGSFGLRIFGQVLTVGLGSEKTAGGDVIAECSAFGSFTTWGRVAMADVKMGGEPKILNMPIQIINRSYPPLPASCNNGAQPILRRPQQVGFNGILGVGLLPNDDYGAYYACNGAGCSATSLTASEEVQNPVALLPVDNNGVVVALPAIPSSGEYAVGGRLKFGIDTESNNQLEGRKVYATDNSLNIQSTYNGQTGPGFIDSGSNGEFFVDGAIPQCTGSEFYCPGGLVGVIVRNTGINATQGRVGVYVGNTIALLKTGGVAFNDLGASLNVLGSQPPSFDFGLPFFFGRKVYAGIAGGKLSPTGGAPYWAY